jgi:hypothetical protein
MAGELPNSSQASGVSISPRNAWRIRGIIEPFPWPAIRTVKAVEFWDSNAVA